MSSFISYIYYNSPLGELKIGSFDGQLCCCDWRYRDMRTSIDDRIAKHLLSEFVESETKVITDCVAQLKSYFSGELKVFDLPIRMLGTDFQIKVWEQLQMIPYGKTESYLGLSRKLQNEKAIRAVASANGANALSILIPCHRIIGSRGELTGYAGGLPAKRKLLELEGSYANQMTLFE